MFVELNLISFNLRALDEKVSQKWNKKQKNVYARGTVRSESFVVCKLKNRRSTAFNTHIERHMNFEQTNERTESKRQIENHKEVKRLINK